MSKWNSDKASDNAWETAILLREGEKISKYWRGSRITMAHDEHRHDHAHSSLTFGFLVLTNQRILWVEERGVFEKSYHPILGIPLENLAGVSKGGKLIKYISITSDLGEGLFRLKEIGSKEFESFRKVILEQVEARKRELVEEKKKEKVQLLLDFSFIKSYMEKGGLVTQTVKCPECTASIKLPESGNQVKCEHCGSIILAQDIFEKVKELIG